MLIIEGGRQILRRLFLYGRCGVDRGRFFREVGDGNGDGVGERFHELYYLLGTQIYISLWVFE